MEKEELNQFIELTVCFLVAVLMVVALICFILFQADKKREANSFEFQAVVTDKEKNTTIRNTTLQVPITNYFIYLDEKKYEVNDIMYDSLNINEEYRFITEYDKVKEVLITY